MADLREAVERIAEAFADGVPPGCDFYIVVIDDSGGIHKVTSLPHQAQRVRLCEIMLEREQKVKENVIRLHRRKGET